MAVQKGSPGATMNTSPGGEFLSCSFSSTTDLTDWTDGCGGIRQKHQKPLAVDADVSYEPLMMCPSVNPSSKLGYFQEATPSTLQGSCIHRKAINMG